MGRAGRWFRSLLGGKKESSSSPNVSGSSDAKPAKEKKRWSFVRSFRDKETIAQPVNGNERRGSYREGSSSCPYIDGVDPNKHAIVVAAATAAVAEAAVAAAQAAAAVVKLTSSGRCATAYVSASGLRREDWAAVKIQAAFRGYLARRALRALKGLVKLQALVRGHIMRKKTADTMRCMQALVRVQARARVGRAQIPETRHYKSSVAHQPGPATPEKYERTIRSNSSRHDRTSTLKWNASKPNSRDIVDLERTHLGRNCMDRQLEERSFDHRRERLIKSGPTDDDKSDKILEIDPGKPHFNSKKGNVFQSSQHSSAFDQIGYSFTTMDSPSKDSTTAQLSTSSPSSDEVQSKYPRRFPHVVDDEAFSTAENSPQFYSAASRPGSSKKGPFTPAKSDCSRSVFSGYSDHPNYMANTESSRAKVRSQSAPKQRLEFEKSGSLKRYSLHGFGESRSQRTSALHANFTSKAYPGSGRLDRLGMPVRSDMDIVGFNGINRNRY